MAILSRKLGRAIRQISELPKGQIPTRRMLTDLLTGWSNEGYAANLEYFEEVARIAVASEGPILECGSGATTILLGLLCGQRGKEVWSLEHSAEWQKRVNDVLQRHGISGVRVCFSPLVQKGEFDWYDAPVAEMPNQFSLVVCDGPPGMTKGGRYGLLPLLGHRLPKGSIILLDDAFRSGEAELIKKWESEVGFATKLVEKGDRGFAIMRRDD
jgi:predicted O-methyltransferase YrrM